MIVHHQTARFQQLGLHLSIQEIQRAGEGALIVRPFESMARFRYRFEFGFYPRGAHALNQPHGLLEGNVLIARAVDRENGGRVGRDPVQRAGAEVRV